MSIKYTKNKGKFQIGTPKHTHADKHIECEHENTRACTTMHHTHATLAHPTNTRAHTHEFRFYRFVMILSFQGHSVAGLKSTVSSDDVVDSMLKQQRRHTTLSRESSSVSGWPKRICGTFDTLSSTFVMDHIFPTACISDRVNLSQRICKALKDRRGQARGATFLGRPTFPPPSP
jgi:hypothetical protein